jgi:16S rRNA (guanine527-N7)-methyltransferase
MLAPLPAYGIDDFVQDTAVSRETAARLAVYADVLTDWQSRMNLVGPSTLHDVWRRHMLDSAQLAPLAGDRLGGTWLDIGAGAGFPGLVLAVLGAGHVHLVESITKKCRFLAAAAEALGVANRVTIHNARIETLARFNADVITARACAALDKLLEWGQWFANANTLWILPKGQDVESELTQAAKSWIFEVNTAPSRSDSRGQILLLKTVRRKGQS